MKILLRMRKYIIGFIVAIISIFAINNDVLADELPVYNLDYDLVTEIIESDENLKSDYNYLLNYIDTIKDDYYVLLFGDFQYSSSKYYYYFYMFIMQKDSTVTIPITVSSVSTTILRLSSFTDIYYKRLYNNYKVGSTSVYDFTNSITSSIESGSFSSAKVGRNIVFNIDKDNNIIFDSNIAIPLYSNFDYIYSVDTFNININGTLITNGNNFITYSEYSPKEELDFITTLKTGVNFIIDNTKNTLDIIVSNELLLVPFAVILLIAVIRIFKVVF